MGESIVSASSYEDKIERTAASDPALQVSVSFGRFESDSLSWEKWSSFSQNKYLEEVEKCAAPGSVAEKRAYFEAHYKKIAARKAELFDQEKQLEHESSMESNQNIRYLTGKTDSDFDVSNGQTSSEGTRHESELDNEWDGGHVDEPYEGDAIDVHGQASLSGLYYDAANDVRSQASLNGRVKEELDNKLDSPVSTKLEELTLIKEEKKGPLQDMRELPKNSEKEMESIPVIKEEKVKLNHQRGFSKIIPMSKARDRAREKKKPEPPVTKQLQISTPKVSKPVPTSSSLSASQSSMKKLNGSLLPRNRNLAGGNKKVTSKSLHLSLTMDPPDSEPASLTTTRKSFIMEKMGDKDIVKRTFKTFQNNFSQLRSSAEERAIGEKQVPAKGTDVKVSTSITPRKENSLSHKSSQVDRRTAKLVPSSSVLRSDERPKRTKEEENRGRD
ncbi:F3I6.9 PROTEIN [Salix purpurea]|uniref:F3I6.9 PROTEIN n=1 Tax=Salix purpurea TaxID=77065 RepID=A0A9Q0Z8U7_SALPP|nr:F3I6.9 PROTEIN [Salix purpurea]